MSCTDSHAAAFTFRWDPSHYGVVPNAQWCPILCLPPSVAYLLSVCLILNGSWPPEQCQPVGNPVFPEHLASQSPGRKDLGRWMGGRIPMDQFCQT